METKITLCPFCDKEQKISLNVNIVKCNKCKKTFEENNSDHHPEEFWHNPNNAVSF